VQKDHLRYAEMAGELGHAADDRAGPVQRARA